MPNRKHLNSEAQKSAQKRRTHKNQARRYKKLLEKDPTNPQAGIWRKKLEFYS